MEELITRYNYELAEPPCAPGSGRYSVKITLPGNISAVFPYLNAILEETVYDHENKVLIGRGNRQQYAFRASEILAAGVEEAAQAPQVVKQVVTLVNRTWQERQSIKPRYTARKLPAVIDIYQLLPRTNCKQCGQPTCLVFAAEVRNGRMFLDQCPLLCQPENAGKKAAIQQFFSAE